MIVDAHNHLFFSTNTNDRTVKTCPIDIDALMDSKEIHRIWLLSLGKTFKQVGYANIDQDQEALRLARKHKGFFVPFAYLDFTKGPAIIDRFHAQGFAGLKAIFPPFAYDDERCFPFYEKAEKHKMPILFHAGGSPYWHPEQLLIGPERLASKNMLIITLDLVAKMFPRLTIILAHLGGKHSYDFVMYFAKGHSNVYLDISCSILEPGRGDTGKIKEVVDMVGANKILFGTDTKGDGPIKKALFWKSYLGLYLGAAARDKIMGLNAENIISASGFDWKIFN